jgi:serine/threonine-protein kinase
MREMGAVTRALAKAMSMRQEVEFLGYKPLLGQLLVEVGIIEVDQASADAERFLEEGVYIAEAAHDDLTVAKGLDSLVYAAGFLLGKRAEGERWARMAAAVLDRLPAGYESSRIRSWLLNDRSFMAWSHGDRALADSLMREAIALKERTVGRDHPDVAVSLSALGSLLTDAGSPQQALTVIDRALEILRMHGDPGSARLARALVNRGEALRALGRFDEAISSGREAVEIDRLGSRKPMFDSIGALGLAELAAGRLSEAVDDLEQAYDTALTSAAPPVSLAELELSLARGLWNTSDDRARAVALAQKARGRFLSAHHDRSQREAETWLATHVLPGKGPLTRRRGR